MNMTRETGAWLGSMDTPRPISFSDLCVLAKRFLENRGLEGT